MPETRLFVCSPIGHRSCFQEILNKKPLPVRHLHFVLLILCFTTHYIDVYSIFSRDESKLIKHHSCCLNELLATNSLFYLFLLTYSGLFSYLSDKLKLLANFQVGLPVKPGETFLFFSRHVPTYWDVHIECGCRVSMTLLNGLQSLSYFPISGRSQGITFHLDLSRLFLSMICRSIKNFGIYGIDQLDFLDQKCLLKACNIIFFGNFLSINNGRSK